MQLALKAHESPNPTIFASFGKNHLNPLAHIKKHTYKPTGVGHLPQHDLLWGLRAVAPRKMFASIANNEVAAETVRGVLEKYLSNERPFAASIEKK